MGMFQWKGALGKKRVELNKTIENKEKIEKTKADIRLESLEKCTHTKWLYRFDQIHFRILYGFFAFFFFFYFCLLASINVFTLEFIRLKVSGKKQTETKKMGNWVINKWKYNNINQKREIMAWKRVNNPDIWEKKMKKRVIDVNYF